MTYLEEEEKKKRYRSGALIQSISLSQIRKK